MRKTRRPISRRRAAAPEYTMSKATRRQYSRGLHTPLLARLRDKLNALKIPHAIPAQLPGEKKKG